LNDAATPVPSVEAAIPEPTNVVRLPLVSIFLITLLPESEINRWSI
jgi:hypothetical protein